MTANLTLVKYYMPAYQSGGVIQAFRYLANAVRFDGTNDYLTRGADLVGNADGKAGLISFWCKFAADGTAYTLYSNEGGFFRIDRGNVAADKITVQGYNTTPTKILELTTNTTITAASGWNHVLISWNLATGAGEVYVNDASNKSATATLTDSTIDYTQTDHNVGSDSAENNKTNADVGDFFIARTFLDITSSANRRKFIGADLKPVNLGADGSIPLGTAPIMFFSGATVDWHTNKGSGGGFTEFGALTDSATSPSD